MDNVSLEQPNGKRKWRFWKPPQQEKDRAKRWEQQPTGDYHNCGPCTIINVASYLGVDSSQLNIRNIRKEVRVPENNISSGDIARFFKTRGVEVQEYGVYLEDHNPGHYMKIINQGLENGATIILPQHGHFKAIVGRKGDQFIILDPFSSGPKEIHKLELAKIIASSKGPKDSTRDTIGIYQPVQSK